jgi:hypothetical protein
MTRGGPRNDQVGDLVMAVMILWGSSVDRSDETFLAVSAALTGFDVAELRATGMVDTYRDLVSEQAGEQLLGRLAADVAAGPGAGDLLAGGEDTAGTAELARAIACVWYLGIWPGTAAVETDDGPEAPFMVSADSYTNGLVWRTIQGRAPGSVGPGHGSWALPPDPGREPVLIQAGPERRR